MSASNGATMRMDQQKGQDEMRPFSLSSSSSTSSSFLLSSAVRGENGGDSCSRSSSSSTYCSFAHTTTRSCTHRPVVSCHSSPHPPSSLSGSPFPSWSSVWRCARLLVMGQRDEAAVGGETDRSVSPEDVLLLDEKRSPAAVVILTTGKATAEPAVTVPTDRNNCVYLIFLLHGVGVLMAWNMFITAKSYFVDHKLSLNASTGSQDLVLHSNDSDYVHVDMEDVKEYRSNFLSYVGLAAQVPNVICNALNLLIHSRKGNLNIRITGMIVIECLVFVLTMILALVDSTSWPGVFFYVTMASVVVMNAANGVYQSAVYGVAAKLPASYSNAVVLGSNISGTLTTLINIISKAVAPDARTAAVYYFTGTLAVLIACLITFQVLPLNKFFRHFDQPSARPESRSSGGSGDGESKRRRYGPVFRSIWCQCLNVWAVFFVTLSIFPAVHSDIQSMGQMSGTLGSYFTLITCFLVFNGTAMIGNLLPGVIGCWPGPQRLWIPVFARFAFIPFFLMCNYKSGERVWPVWITSDHVYVAGGSLMGLSSGYFSSLAMMYAPRLVTGGQEDAATAAMMASFFLMLGIFSGINSSFILSAIVT